ncbi:carbon monoxide dehydrogenase [Bacillus salipaludis]|uniref:Carbon monoxide dehydrogenase n=1 Tax=Bacillus salipaludis TaxID=2547811 RepID=A0A4R5VSN7_9BACI|nr:carbon monoxide dehydrogenase [Bacillus salipaludis]TDK61798.1 carbon monoxide dehydrogenase [Bacillus salipaludis]
MRRKICLMFSLICTVILSASDLVFAKTIDRPLTTEECYIKMGYKSVEEAVKDFENHFKEDVRLPSMKPSIPFNLQFGKFHEDKAYNTNDYLDIQFMHKKLLGNNFTINIRTLENKLVFKEKPGQKLYTLKNGQKALYFEHRFSSNFLVFESDHWQYMFGIDKRVSDKVTPEVLVEIANSIPE